MAAKMKLLPEATLLYITATQGWKLGAVFFFGITCTYLYFINQQHTEKYLPRSHDDVSARCIPGDAGSRAAMIISNYSREHTPFLQLSDYFWVMNQSKFALPYGTNGSEEDLVRVLALMQNINLPKRIESLQCRRCVVVGNSYRLKNSSMGEIIDQYDVVIRLNIAPVHKYERDVGSKTTLRLFYPESANFDIKLDNNPDTLMVLVPMKNKDLQWLKAIINNEKMPREGFWNPVPQVWDVAPEKLRILNPYYMEEAAMNLLGYNEKTKTMNAVSEGGQGVNVTVPCLQKCVLHPSIL